MATAKTSYRRLSEIAPAGCNLTPMEDLQGRDWLLTEAIPTDTQFGPGYRLTVQHIDTDETFECLTSAVVVVKQIDKMILDKFALPCIVQFVKQGRAWVIV